MSPEHQSSDEIEVLRTTARELLADNCSPERVHEVIDREEPYDYELWRLMTELGWPGVTIEEELGGAGYGESGLSVLVEETGRRLAGTPFVPGAVAALALGGCEPGEARDRLLGGIAEGRERVAVAMQPLTDPEVASVSFDPGQGTLGGSAGILLTGGGVDEVLVPVRHESGVALALVLPGRDGVGLRELEPMDRTRGLASLGLEEVKVTSGELLLASEGIDRQLVDSAARIIAADCLGAASAALDLSVGYAKERRQFGREIGSFQAVKHAAADMFVAVEGSRSSLAHAYEALEADDPAAASLAASAAKAHCADAYARVAGSAVQVHGGIGFSWESDAQLHLKRAKLNQQVWGSTAWHRQRAAGLLLDAGDGEGGSAP